MTHTEKRLIDRDVNLSPAQVAGLVYEYGDLDQSLGLIVARCGYCDDNCIVILIIRNNKAVTVLTRRVSQHTNANILNVNRLIDLTQ